MTQENKELLLRDLCARLPYGVKVHGVFLNYNKDKDKILYEECDDELNYKDLNRYESLKPYLRPMSSMTKEEKKEFYYVDGVLSIDFEFEEYKMVHLLKSHNVVDWLNANHFDYRGLILRNLAIAVTEENNPYKN